MITEKRKLFLSFLLTQHGPLEATKAVVNRLTPTYCCRCITQRHLNALWLGSCTWIVPRQVRLLKAAMPFAKRLTPTHCCRCTTLWEEAPVMIAEMRKLFFSILFRCTTQRAAPWPCVTPARAASTCCAWAWSGRSCRRGTGPAPAVLSARACPPSASLWMKSRTGSPLEAAGAFLLMPVC